MSINLETRAEPLEVDRRRTTSSSFFIDGEQQAEPGLAAKGTAQQTLYERTQTIHAWQPEIGYPAFFINDQKGKTKAMVSTGLDLDQETAVWQINVYGQGTILHGQTTQTGDRWQSITRDRQGRLWQEATLWDKNSPGLLSSFVISAISKVNNLDVIAETIIQNRAANKIEYDHYRAWLQKKDKFGYGDKRQKDLLRAYFNAKFESHDAISLQHMVEPNKDDYCRWQNIGSLPAMVRELLASTDYQVVVQAPDYTEKSATETE